MTERAEKRIDRAAVRRRRDEVIQRLAEFGLARGPRRLSPNSRGEASHFRGLAAALASLGPVFSLFGIYLASRADLFKPKDCLELAAIPDQAEPSRGAAIHELFVRETGGSIDENYSIFEEDPFESRLLYQTHRARLKNATEVTVRIAHPELEERLPGDAELLPLLEGAFAAEVIADFDLERAITGFRRALAREMDFVHQADAIDLLAGDARDFDMLAAPAVHRSLSSSRVLTAEWPSGPSVADVIAGVHKWEIRRAGGARTFDVDPNDLARRLCRVWLRQALLGAAFPVDPRPESVIVVSEKRIAFAAGSFASFSSGARTNLRNYLLAAASEEPDKACSYLLKEMEEGQSKAGQEDLERKFRQVAPFRDGGWGGNSGGDSLAEQLFVQWRITNASGCRPSFHLLSFYRGLFLIAAAAEQLAPRRDSLAAGLDDVRLMEVLGQFQEMAGVRGLGDGLDKYARMMVEMPGKLDEVLSLAAEGNARLKLRIVEAAGHKRQKNSLAAASSLLLLLAAVVLLSHHLAKQDGEGAWAEKIGAVLCVLIGTMALVAASRTR